MELILVVISIALFFMWRASNAKGKLTADAMTMQSLAQLMDEAGFDDETVRYAVYRGKPYAMTGGAIVTGIGRLASGEDVGFVAEVHDSMGPMQLELIRPYEIATFHKDISLKSLQTGMPMITIYREAVRRAEK